MVRTRNSQSSQLKQYVYQNLTLYVVRKSSVDRGPTSKSVSFMKVKNQLERSDQYSKLYLSTLSVEI